MSTTRASMGDLPFRADHGSGVRVRNTPQGLLAEKLRV